MVARLFRLARVNALSFVMPVQMNTARFANEGFPLRGHFYALLPPRRGVFACDQCAIYHLRANDGLEALLEPSIRALAPGAASHRFNCPGQRDSPLHDLSGNEEAARRPVTARIESSRGERGGEGGAEARCTVVAYRLRSEFEQARTSAPTSPGWPRHCRKVT